MTSTKMNMRCVLLLSLGTSVGMFVVGSAVFLVSGDANTNEELVLLCGFCLFLFVMMIPLLRGAYKYIPSPYYHWED